MSGGSDRTPTGPALSAESQPAEAPNAEQQARERQFLTITLEEVLRPTGIAGMITCLMVAFSQFLVSLTPHWPGTFVSVLTFLVSLESIHAWRTMKRLRLSGSDKTRFRFAEWIVLLLVLRLGVSLRNGFAGLAADIASWTVNALSFFDALFLIISALMVLVWFMALGLAQTMKELEATESEKAPATTDPRYDLWSTAPGRGRVDRTAKLRHLINTFFGAGIILLIFTGLSLVNLRQLLSLEHARSSGIIVNVFVYFVLGFLLISQAHYTILKANWELQNIPILGKLGKRWLLLVLGFLVFIALVAALLPVDYSVGIMDVLSTVLWWILQVLTRIVGVILFIISWVLGLVLSLFRGEQAASPPPTISQPMLPPPPPSTAAESEPVAWWQFVRSLLFWFLIIGVAGYSLYHFLNDRWDIFRRLSMTPLLQWISNVWRGLRQNTRQAVGRLRQAVAQSIARRRARIAQRTGSYLSLRRLTPRDRVRYFYLSIAHRANTQGFGRPASMTPLEYQQMLASQMPDADVDVEALTQAFLEARYSEHAITEEQMRGVQGVWQRIKRALSARRRQRAGNSAKPGSQTANDHAN
ncbi:MAG: DUF4129 domain-containing protein [Chloroflexi bacterium]|jgi:tetrahydromethanopterin S-methyltransferase subunit B|nr:DUF4129 domain-containing protein [Chloroflexota bacterium]